MRASLLIVTCAAASLVSAAAALADVQAQLTTSSVAPRVGEAWRWTISAYEGTKPVPARVRLQVLSRGVVVGCFKDKAIAACTGRAAGDALPFTGKRTGVLRWPTASIGEGLRFQAVVITAGGTVRLRTLLSVRPAG